MPIRFVVAVATATFLSYGGLALADGRAGLATPQAKSLDVIAGSAIWHCAGSSCVSADATDQAADTWACRAITKAVGQVVSFEVNNWKMPADKLAKCNSAIRPAPATSSNH